MATAMGSRLRNTLHRPLECGLASYITFRPATLSLDVGLENESWKRGILGGYSRRWPHRAVGRSRLHIRSKRGSSRSQRLRLGDCSSYLATGIFLLAHILAGSRIVAGTSRGLPHKRRRRPG
jgi:hypothetical protein